MTDRSTPTRRGRIGRIALVVAVAAVAVFPFVARWRADSLRRTLPEAATLPPMERAPTATFRLLPALSDASPYDEIAPDLGDLDVAAVDDAIDETATRLLSPAGAATLSAVLAGDASIGAPWEDECSTEPCPTVSYPFEFRTVDDLLDKELEPTAATVATVNDLAVLLMLRATSDDASVGHADQRSAYALFRWARDERSDCLPQLNLAFLLSLDYVAWDDAVVREFERAIKLCPGEATPYWFLGQFQLNRTYLLDPYESIQFGKPPPTAANLRQRPVDTFRALQEAYPGSPLAWAGEADVRLRFAYEARTLQPFTARADARLADTLYDRAIDLDPNVAAHLRGAARAAGLLGRPDQAVEDQRAVAEMTDYANEDHERLVQFRTDAHRYAEAVQEHEAWHTAAKPLASGRWLGRSGSYDFGVQAHEPLSTGALEIDATTLVIGHAPGAGAGTLADWSLIPDWRATAEITDLEPGCFGAFMQRNLLLADDPRILTFDPHEDDSCGSLHTDALLWIARFEEDPEVPLIVNTDLVIASREDFGDVGIDYTVIETEDAIFDVAQNLFRFGDQLDRAERLVAEWIERRPESWLAHDRQGEIAYLQGRHDDAAAAFTRAWNLAPTGLYGEWVSGYINAKHGLVALTAGDFRTAVARFDASTDAVGPIAERFAEYQAAQYDERLESEFLEDAFPDGVPETAWGIDGVFGPSPVVLFQAEGRWGDVALRVGEYAEALPHYERAERAIAEPNGTVVPIQAGSHRIDVLAGNYAVAAVMAGDQETAEEQAALAQRADPGNPIVIMSAAYVDRQGGRIDAAVEGYRRALEADPTLYPAANDLGVLLALIGDDDGALDALRHAVAIAPGYALGWYNLGVVLARDRPGRLLESQGALGQAFSLDKDLREVRREPVEDVVPYITDLDVSRPLPAAWNFAASQSSRPLLAAGAVFVLTLLNLGVFVLKDTAVGKAIERLLTSDQPKRSWRRMLTGRIAAWVGILLCVAVVIQRPWRWEGSAPEEVAVAVGVLTLVAAYMLIRSWRLQTGGVAAGHRTWSLSASVGLIAFVVPQLPWIPLPSLYPETHTWRQHAVGPTILAAATVSLFALAAATGVPVTRSLALAALLMTACSLVPARPIDGGYLPDKRVLLLGGFALLAVGAVVDLGWL